MPRRRQPDGLEIMGADNPVDPALLDGPGSPKGQEMLARVLAIPRVPNPSPRPRVRIGRIALITAILIAVPAAVWALTRGLSNPEAIVCFADVSVDADRAGAPFEGPADATACVSVWEQVLIESPQVEPGEVPPLTACVLDQGSLGVFPTDDEGVCEALGLAVPDPAQQAEADAVRGLLVDLVEFIETDDCMPMEAAEAGIRHILDESGFGHWEIRSQAATDERPCASLGFEPENSVVHLVPSSDLTP
ncbi:MAG TPA: hypothetical protein VK088_07485 [Acidimicrobiia bacterium]|nr:hypothetical protein [Acidimicrobiia bacterium]